MPESTFDVIVIGAGSTGENVAARAVKGGLSAVVVESGLVGGECSYVACMPSKALLRSNAVLEAARRVGGAREAVKGSLDVPAVLARRTYFTKGWKDDSQVQWLAKTGITLVRGHGRIAGERKVEVASPGGSSAVLSARHAVAICTGSDPALPPIPGLAEAKPWTNREATRTDRVPQRLAILGGGPVACEMATAFGSFGSAVTVFERAERLLGRMEPFVGDQLARAMKERGIDVRVGANVTRAERAARGSVSISFDQAGASGDGWIEADEILVAVGRTARTSDIGLDRIGLKPGEWLNVDDTCRVNAVAGGWLYAAGDVNHRTLLTHMGKYQGRACGDAIVARAKGELETSAPDWSRWSATADHRAVPEVVFTDPEIASVGLTEEQARQHGFNVRAAEYEIGSVAGAGLTADGYSGHAKMVVDESRSVIVGVTFIGQDVGELIHAGTVAVAGEVPLQRLWHAVPSYPTTSEIWLRLLEAYGL